MTLATNQAPTVARQRRRAYDPRVAWRAMLVEVRQGYLLRKRSKNSQNLLFSSPIPTRILGWGWHPPSNCPGHNHGVLRSSIPSPSLLQEFPTLRLQGQPFFVRLKLEVDPRRQTPRQTVSTTSGETVVHTAFRLGSPQQACA